MVVLSVIALLTAILSPVFTTAKKSAKKTSCQSNLRQIGLLVQLYGSDWEDCYPYAIDQFSRHNLEALSDFTPPYDQIPDMVTVLNVYSGRSAQIWKCPSDQTSFAVKNSEGVTIQSFPSAFDFAGSSYKFDFPYKIAGKSQTLFDTSSFRLCGDAGLWHCDVENTTIYTKTQNELFGDGHVHFVSIMDQS